MRRTTLILATLALVLGLVVVVAMSLDINDAATAPAWTDGLGLLALGLLPLCAGLVVLRKCGVGIQSSEKRSNNPQAEPQAQSVSTTLLACGLIAVLLSGTGVWWKLRPLEVAQATDDPDVTDLLKRYPFLSALLDKHPDLMARLIKQPSLLEVLKEDPGLWDRLKAAELDKAKQQYVWKTEHVTFQIETHVAKPFAKALQEKDASKLKGFFTADFQGNILAGKPASREQGVINQRKLKSAAATRPPTDAAGVVAALLKAVEGMATIDRSSLRVLKIDAVDARQTDWRLDMLLTVVGRSESGGPRSFSSDQQVRMKIADESKIQPSNLIHRWQFESETNRTSPQPVLKEVTGSVGFPELKFPDNWNLPPEQNMKNRYQVAVADFNGDGYPDILLTSPPRHWLLKSEMGKRFVDVTQELLPRLPPRTQIVAGWIDYDNDGDPDLILRDRLLRNDGGKEFVDVTARSGLTFGTVPMGCSVVDYDCDGRLDLYVLYDIEPQERSHKPKGLMPWVGDTESGVKNQLWRNVGGGRFREVTDEAGASGGRRRSFAAVWFHYDQDHFPDLYVVNEFSGNVLLRNRGDGTFEDLSAGSGASDYANSMGVAAGDLDNDGSPELYVANMYSKMGRRIIAHVSEKDYPPGIYHRILGACSGSHLYQRRHGQTGYQEISDQVGVNAVGWAWGPAMADFDADGWLDIYATAGFMSFNRKRPDG